MSGNGDGLGSTRRYDLNEINDRLSTRPTRTNKNVRGKKNKDMNRNKKNKKQNKAWKVVKIILITILVLGILAALIIGGIIAGLFLGLFGNDFKLTKEDLLLSNQNSEVYNADGKLIATLTGDEKRKIVPMSEMSKYLPKAYVAIEDERFYSHTGVDIKRTAAATLTYLLNGGSSSFGGSTITQQLVKNITKDDEDTATRKIKEMAKALQVEKLISKDQILELYLNIIFVGGNNIHGVALGAEYYFDKDVSKLSLAESAYLAGINNSPNMYHPFSDDQEDIDLVKTRTKTVLNKMKELGFVNDEEYNEAIKDVDEGLKFKRGKLTSGQVYSYITECAVDEVVEQLMEEKGMSRDLAEITVYGGGLKIYTTEDASIQKAVEKEMSKDKYVKKSRKNKGATTQSSMVIINQKTGEVVACQGKLGKKDTNGDLNRATQLLKQTGSSFKPLACIAPGINEGVITAASVYQDKPVKYTGVKNKTVKNQYSGYKGAMSVRHAIEISCNTVEVQIIQDLGVSTSLEYLNKMGFAHLKNEGESMALGGLTYGASSLEMAAAYACIANGGEYIEPTFYSKVTDASDNVVLEPTQKKEQVISEAAAFVVTDILTEPVYGTNGATARYCAIPGIETAAKTGTTQDDNDRWLCGFTPYYTAAVWYGYDKNETVSYRGYPSNPAGSIWSYVMKDVHEGMKNKKFTVPNGVVKDKVCKRTGLAPAKGCPTVTDYFVKGTIPKKTCDESKSMKSYTICSDTGLLANDACPNTEVIRYYPDDEDLDIPTKHCNKHKEKEEEPKEPEEKPEEPEEKPEKPEEPEEKPEEPEEKPEEKPDPGEGATDPPTTGGGSGSGTGSSSGQ